MKLLVLVLCLTFFAVFSESKTDFPMNKAGITGRYCTIGTYDINTGHLTDYKQSHYCGVHLDVPMCVSVGYTNNITKMNCDNAGGIFPKCTSNGCSWQGNLIICCCDSDSCNDCSQNPSWCLNPLSEETKTSTAAADTNGNQPDPHSTDSTPKPSKSPPSKFTFEIFVLSLITICVLKI